MLVTLDGSAGPPTFNPLLSSSPRSGPRPARRPSSAVSPPVRLAPCMPPAAVEFTYHTDVANYNGLSVSGPDTKITQGNPNYDEIHYIQALSPLLSPNFHLLSFCLGLSSWS